MRILWWAATWFEDKCFIESTFSFVENDTEAEGVPFYPFALVEKNKGIRCSHELLKNASPHLI